jgi:uncharacterized protein YprB with RNaseH-like and TPR domain
LRKCLYDGCHIFTPNAHNHVYCVTCKCKRKEETRKKILERPLEYDEETFQLEENRKFALTERNKARNLWILRNKSFAFFDIETTDLSADGDEVLCASIKPLGSDVVTHVSETRAGKGSDHGVVLDIRDHLREFDYVVTWFGTRFDMPFITTRLVIHDEDTIGYLKHVDLYYTARHQLRLHSNRLQAVEEALFEGKSLKTRLSKPLWKNATGWNKEKREAAFDYIIEHCEKDVISLEEIFLKLVDLRNLSATPLRKY